MDSVFSNEGGRLMRAKLICCGLAVFTALACLSGRLYAGDPYKPASATGEVTPMPAPAQVQTLTAYPSQIKLKGSDDAQQLVLTAGLGENLQQDLSADVKYEIADPKIARVTASGRVIPLADGHTEITATYGPKTVKVSVTAEAVDQNL